MSDRKPGLESPALIDEAKLEQNQTASQSWLSNQLRAFQHRDYVLYFFGMLISFIGSWIQMTALQWLTYQLTNSKFLLGLTTAVGTLPMLFFSLFAGVVADRFSKRNLIIVTQTAAMLLAFVLAALTYWHIINIYHIIIIGFLAGVVTAFDWPARQSFVIEMVGREDLANAIAMNSAMFNSARVVGPAIAGIMLVHGGAGMAFFVNGVSFLAAIGGLFLMTVTHTPAESHPSVLSSLKEGLRYVRGNKMVKALMVLAGAVAIFAQPYSVLLPAFAKENLGGKEGVYSLLLTVIGVGALFGALTTSSANSYRRKVKLLIIGSLVFCLTAAAFTFSHTLYISIGLLVILGWGVMVTMSMMNTLVQILVPDELRGRVISVYTLMIMGMAPLGSLQIGTVAHKLGAPLAVQLSAIVFILIMVCLIPKLRAEHPPELVS